MRTGEFAATDWVERLAQALTELAKTQERYRNELDRQRRHRVRIASELPRWRTADHPSHDLRAFYSDACAGKDRYYAGEYSLLCAALAEVRHVLAAHPAWAGVVDPSDDRDKVLIHILDHGHLGTLLSVTSGLMARGMEVPEDGFRVAASELNGLLDPGGDPEQISGPGDLSVGYHVALFHGLRVRGEVRLADDMTLLPFEQLDAFVNEDILQDVAPAVIRYNLRETVGALVKPFRWKPEFRKRDDRSVPCLDWGRSFFEDAEAFGGLLALFHAAPVICLATIPYCIHRTASYLLGESHYPGNYQWGHSARSVNIFVGPTDLRVDAFDEAKKAFGSRKSAHYQDCTPIIARLAEALARSGRFRTEDKILDVAIALERMYELAGGEISFKLKTRAACFLETGTEDRLRVFRDVEQLYNVRSAIVHKRKKQLSAEAIQEAFSKGFEVARRSVVKLLRDGPPLDWNELVIVGTEPSASTTQGGDGTTEPG